MLIISVSFQSYLMIPEGNPRTNHTIVLLSHVCDNSRLKKKRCLLVDLLLQPLFCLLRRRVLHPLPVALASNAAIDADPIAASLAALVANVAIVLTAAVAVVLQLLLFLPLLI